MKTKTQLHPRNIHNKGYDFDSLCKDYPDLKPHVFQNDFGTLTIDFANQASVIALNAALLSHHYDVTDWTISSQNLCPPIPGRVDYIHYLADLLKETNNNQPVFNGSKIQVLDIGTGAGCIYPILGNRVYKWNFTGTDIDPESLKASEKILQRNLDLKNSIQLKLQPKRNHIFRNIMSDEKFDLTMCNPPFHRSLKEGKSGTERKWKNLNNDSKILQKDSDEESRLNFGGQKAELWCEGGEVRFISNMINESKHIPKQVLWFTSLVSKKDNVSKLKLVLKKAQAEEIKVIKMSQGNKVSRFLAWTFLSQTDRNSWCKNRF